MGLAVETGQETHLADVKVEALQAAVPANVNGSGAGITTSRRTRKIIFRRTRKMNNTLPWLLYPVLHKVAVGSFRMVCGP